MRTRLGALLLVAFVAFVTAAFGCGGVDYAETIYTNGKFYTLDPEKPWAEAVAVRGGRILAVGAAADMEAFTVPVTKTVDLGGKMVIPGLHDVHVHSLDVFSDRAGGRLHIPAGSDREALEEAITRYARGNTGYRWVVGGDYPIGMFPDENAPKELLDKLVPERPAAILHVSGHALWVNSKALEIAGIDRNTPDPELGIIVRKPGSQEPAGTLKEAAMPLVMKHYFGHPDKVWRKGARITAEEFNRRGITSVRSATGRQAHLDALRAVDAEGGLTLRYLMTWNWSTTLIEPISDLGTIAERIQASLDPEKQTPHVRSNSVKVFMDGGFDSHTAALMDPYADKRGERGLLNIEPEKLNEDTIRFDKMGVSVLFHCIGDRATKAALDAVRRARGTNGPGMRHQISHNIMARKKEIERMADLGVSMDCSPIMPLTAGLRDYLGQWLGDRVGNIFPMRWAIDAGARPALASDHGVTPIAPFHDIETLVTRRDPVTNEGPELGSAQKITLEEAIRACTLNGAFAMMQENDTGSLVPGKFADFAVLSQELFEVPASQISETEVLMTVFEGEVVYEKGE